MSSRFDADDRGPWFGSEHDRQWLGVTGRREWLEICDSTNDEAAARARAGAPHGCVVAASAQRQGRGRQGRVWHSPPGDNIYLSCVLRPDAPPPTCSTITLAAGIAVAEALASLGAPAELKWPNDVLSNHRKLAGILSEMNTQGNRVNYVILGIGVNLNTTDFPPPLDVIATSVRRETGIEVTAQNFVHVLLERLEFWLDRWAAGGVAAISDRWLVLAGIGMADGGDRHRTRNVRVEIDGQTTPCEAIGLDDDGALLVRDASGVVRRVVVGDVEILR